MDPIIHKRGVQLEEQSVIDDNLRALNEICPETVAEYLLARRFINRKQYEKTKQGGILEAYPNINKNIQETDKDQSVVKELLNRTDYANKNKDRCEEVCKTLHKYTQQLLRREVE